jgi:hypothetical protein
MENLRVNLRPIISGLNLPTAIKTTIMPNDNKETLFVATQVGEIFYLKDNKVELFLDLRPHVIKLGSNGGYDERGLLGLAFHPFFYENGLFYLHYSLAGTQGSGAIPSSFKPDPCNKETLNLKWTNRTKQFDHIDTVEEWIYQKGKTPTKVRTLLNIRRPYSNHNGVHSLNFSPQNGKLILTTGDGGAGFDPFNLAQDDLEIAGKILEIDVEKKGVTNNPIVVSRFDELPIPILEIISVMVKGVRNIPGITFKWENNQFTKYVGNVGQNLVESIFSFNEYTSIPATNIVNGNYNKDKIINLGWRPFEGTIPTSFVKPCQDSSLNEKVIAYYQEAINTSTKRLLPLVSYYHDDERANKIKGTALTGYIPYLGTEISRLTNHLVFIDLLRKETNPPRGALLYTNLNSDFKTNDYGIINVNYDYNNQPAFYVSLGSNISQTKLYLGVYNSMNVTNLNQGTIFEIIP